MNFSLHNFILEKNGLYSRTVIRITFRWLENVHNIVSDKSDNHGDEDDVISWAAYQLVQKLHSDISVLLPLFRDDLKSPAMIKHAMNVIQKAVRYLNENQTLVIALYQPLYAITKEIQWKWSS